MKVANWNDILPTHEAIRAMAPEKLEAASGASTRYVATLAFGIAGIGNLLACTASNSETGLSEEAVTHVGWLLDALGDLIGKLADTDAGVQYQIQKNEEVGGVKPKAALARRSGENTLGSTNARV
jgi:hypothetical protein